MDAAKIISQLLDIGNPVRASNYQRFFKTGPGEYGEGDVFIGVKVPELRKIAKENINISTTDVKKLIQHKIHEVRLLGVLILTYQFKKRSHHGQYDLFRFYIYNKKHINNWDLVDVSAPIIVGEFLLHKNKEYLDKMILDKNKWTRRIAMVSTLTFIRYNHLTHTFKYAAILMKDKFDLSHKAAGWMLRECGKKDKAKLVAFLNKHIKHIPRVMLRYAIEHFPENERQEFLKK